MQKAQAQSLLAMFRDHAVAIGSADSAAIVGLVADLIEVLPGKKLSDCLTSLSSIEGVTRLSAKSCVKAAAVVSAYAELTKSLGKLPVSTQLQTLSDALQLRSEQSLEQLILAARDLPTTTKKAKSKTPAPPANEAIVFKYNKLLEEALGDDLGFSQLIDKLDGDAQVTANDMIALAKRFAVVSTKSRSAALKKIVARHTALMSSRARSAATAGRSAG